MERLVDIRWQQCAPELERLLAGEGNCEIERLVPGFEAQVFKLSARGQQYVLKRWNAESQPDIRLQYELLSMLHRQQLAVPTVYGYGFCHEQAVLLTSYNGAPIRKITTPQLSLLARELARLHQISSDTMQGVTIPTYERSRYFYVGIDDYEELAQALDELVHRIVWRERSIVHADYHLGNIVYDGERYTTIDWTNMQQEDARLDVAWALLMLELYVSARYERVFRQAYLEICPQASEQLEWFTALAFVRWLMQYEKGHTPKLPAARKRAQALLQRNEWLQQQAELLPGWSRLR
ncbi:aminoglycoside phosphotransferase family protein [Paenibacillus campi]|uniref:phosphotransferase family protein n=1 Tax=Paenibacillus campi TaxID=3106031 RepID=UPI002AFECF23|nr:aminoglycoside phosphotransferase family protein [Paenibacillus sp. SGZ-1009]